MNIKALFLDIDGTLVSFRTHLIPASTIDVLTEVKQRGVSIYIATGRPTSFINNLSPIAHLVDGYITSNGAKCSIHQKTIFTQGIERDDVNRILHICDQTASPCILCGEESVAVHHHQPIVDETMGKGLGLENYPYDSVQHVLQQEILQMTAFFSPEEEVRMSAQLNHCQSARWTPLFTDITHACADKGKALLTMARETGISVQDTMAFGDGGNDITMLQQAGIGVAMGNADLNVQQQADYTTSSVDEDGIRNALLHFGLLS